MCRIVEMEIERVCVLDFSTSYDYDNMLIASYREGCKVLASAFGPYRENLFEHKLRKCEEFEFHTTTSLLRPRTARGNNRLLALPYAHTFLAVGKFLDSLLTWK